MIATNDEISEGRENDMTDQQKEATPADRLYLYCLVRTDLESLGVGKAVAHGVHVGNHMTWRHVVEPLQRNEMPRRDVMDWHAIGGGFGTAIALGKNAQIDLRTLKAVTEAATTLGHVADVIIDGTYPYQVPREIVPLIDPSVHTAPPAFNRDGAMCFRRETTMGYVFGDKNDLQVLLTRFGLMPNDPLDDPDARRK